MGMNGFDLLLIAESGETLDLKDGVTYATDVGGLFDFPTQDVRLSSGYQRGAAYNGTVPQARQFSLTVTIVAGMNDPARIHNPTHLAARDTLIRFFSEGGLLTLRTQYPGTAGYYDIAFQSGGAVWQPGSSTYIFTCNAPAPYLISSISNSQVALLTAAFVERIFTITVGGNTATWPQIVLQPTAAKPARWNYQQLWTVTNPSDTGLHRCAVRLPFNFAATVGAGHVRADGGDLRVLVNSVVLDRFLVGITQVDGSIWCEIDLEAYGSTDVQVLYGNPSATWSNTGAGPMFDLALSTNLLWIYLGRFMDVPSVNSGLTQQWNPHFATAVGMVPFRRHLPAPWLQPAGEPVVNAAGGEVPTTANVQGYAGLALHHPLKISQVAIGGYTQLDPTKIKLVVRTLDDDGTLTDVWQLLADTQNALTYFNTTVIFPAPMPAVAIALRSLSVHTSQAGLIGGAQQVNVTIATPVTLSGGSETAIYTLDALIENQTTGESISLFTTVPKDGSVWETVVIDPGEQIVTVGATNAWAGFAQNGAIRRLWLRLVPGANVIRIRDEGTAGLTATVLWQAHRL